MSRKRWIIFSDSDEEEAKRQHLLPVESNLIRPLTPDPDEDFVVSDGSVQYDTEYEPGSSSSYSSMSSGESEDELEELVLPEVKRDMVGGGPCFVCKRYVIEREWIKEPLRRWGFTAKNAQKCDLVCDTCSPAFTLSRYHMRFVLNKHKAKRHHKCTAVHRVIPMTELQLFNSIRNQTIGLDQLESLIVQAVPGSREYNGLQEELIELDEAITTAFDLCMEEITPAHLFASCLYGNVTPSRGVYCLFCCNEQNKNKGSEFYVSACTRCEIKTDAFCHPASLCNRCFRSRYCHDKDDPSSYV